jgi:nucleoside 2-deoxyribosyltransferase
MNFERFKVGPHPFTRIYLGAPYSHSNPLWMKLRFELINLAALQLIQDGFIVFSPISHSHPIASAHADPQVVRSYKIWLEQDVHFMEWADLLVVLELPGWRDSKGLLFERKWFEEHNKPIDYMHLNDVYYAEIDRALQRRLDGSN